MRVGQVARSGAPDPELLERIGALLEDDARLGALAHATHDPRMDFGRWRIVLAVELAQLFRWIARRHMERAKAPIGPPLPGFSDVLSLLPGYGFALHMLRRAAPFAALGIRTSISVAAGLRPDAERCMEPLCAALKIEDWLRLEPGDPAGLVDRYAREGNPIVLTGRAATYELLRRRYPDARLLAATGECVVVLGTDWEAVNALSNALGEKALKVSCSIHRLTIYCSGSADELRLARVAGAYADQHPGNVATEIARVHPSVVLYATRRAADAPSQSTLAGYRIVPCGTDGEPLSRDGFGLDPVGGWPGDYLV